MTRCTASLAVPSGGGSRIVHCALDAGHYDGPTPGDRVGRVLGIAESWHTDDSGVLNWADTRSGASPHGQTAEPAEPAGTVRLDPTAFLAALGAASEGDR